MSGPVATPAEAVVSQVRISCKGLTKSFYDIGRNEEVVALRDVSLTIGDGEFLTVLGPSGCGKTTFMNILAGFETGTAGTVELDGDPIRGPGPDRGVVFQEYALFPWLTITQNVGFGLRERGVPRDERRTKVSATLDAVGLTGFGDRYPQELSGGMRQRVALARVLANEPKILLMDEPFAALDAQTRSLMQQELLTVWEKSRRSVVFITHNIEEAVFLGSRILIMTARPGRIKKIVDIDLPRPRDVTSAAFNDIRRAVTELLEDEVQRAFEEIRRSAALAKP